MDLKEENKKWAVNKFVGGKRESVLDMPIDTGGKLGGKPNMALYTSMMTDPGISFPLHLLKLPVSRSRLVYTNSNADIQKFVTEELEELKRTILFNALTALEYGFAPFERRFEMRDGMYRYKEFIHLRPDYIWIKMHPVRKNFNGIEQRYKGKTVTLSPEKSYVFSYQSYFTNLYGSSQISFAYIPWILDKEFYRYHGVALQEFGIPTIVVSAPEGLKKVDMGEAGEVEITNLEFIKLVAESVRSRSVVGKPPGDDWFMKPLFERKQAFWDFNKDHEWLDLKKALAILIPPEIWKSGGGSYAKSKVQSFWFEQTIASILDELTTSVFRHIIKPIVRLNFWDGKEEPPYGELIGKAPSLEYNVLLEKLIQSDKNKENIDWRATYKLMRVPLIEEKEDSFGLTDIPHDIKSLEGLCRKAFNRGIEIGKEQLAYTGFVPLSSDAKETLKNEASRLQYMLRKTSNQSAVLGVVLGRLRSEGLEQSFDYFHKAIESGNYRKLGESENEAA